MKAVCNFVVIWLLIVFKLSLCIYIPPGPKYRCPVDERPIFPCKCQTGGDDGFKFICEFTGIAPLSTAFVNMASDPISRLTLSNVRFTKLFGEALRPLNVNELNIQDSPIVSIESMALLGVNQSMHSLILNNTKLSNFPGEALSLLGELKSLVIQNHEIETIAAGAIAIAGLENLQLTQGSIIDIVPDTFSISKKLKRLSYSSNNITEIKRGAFRGLRDLELLDLSYNQLSKVDPAALADLPKLSYLNISNNALNELPRGGFARNTLLRHLDLSNNKLTKVDANSFRGLRFLRRLIFSDNVIEEVGRGAFSSITRIGTIDLARNLLTKVDFQLFAGLKFAEKIDVSENRITEIQRRAFTDLYAVLVNVSHNALVTIEAGAFENCINMSILDLSHNSLTKITKNAFDTLSYAADFKLEFNSIADFSTIPLQNMTGLQKLNVSYNALNSIPRNAFPKLYDLNTIDLSHNQITNIANAVFQPLISLRFLNLSHNSMGKINSATLGALPTLLELDLRDNQLTELGRGAIARLSSLRNILLGNNQIAKMSFQLSPALSVLSMPNNSLENFASATDGESVWPTMNALLELDIRDNKLGDSLAEDNNAFSNLLTLKTLHLERNGLTKPPKAALGPLTSLQYLYLTGNNIQKLPKQAFGQLPIVFELELSHNGMNNISVRAFEGLLQLLTLNVSYNNLSYIPNGAFQSLVSLRTLDLSHNSIEKLDNKTHGLIDDCLSLERVNLSNNKIGFITRPMFPSSPYIPYKLKEIDLSYNTIPVLTGDLTWGAKKVKKLNVSHNILNEIRQDVLGNLTSLTELDISYNELTEFIKPKYSRMFPLNLTNLWISNNYFTASLPLKDIENNKFKILDLRNNKIDEFSEELSNIVENGTHLLFSGNPIKCDCMLRPLLRWLQTKPNAEPWDSVKCEGPEFLKDKLLHELSEDRLTCSKQPKVQKLRITPDLTFRNVARTKNGGVKLTWYVSSRQDIGDFQIIVRNKDTQDNIFEKEVSYTIRSDTLPPLPEKQNLQLCLLARDSQGNVRIWRESQCTILGDKTSTATRVMYTTVTIIVVPVLSLLLL